MKWKRYNEFIYSLIGRKRTNAVEGSNKIVYIGHSYHLKTKSSLFIQELLSEYFELEVIHDDSWDGKTYPDLSFIDQRYLGVVFWQNLPPKKELKRMKNKNLVFFPMYDGVGRTYDWWKDFKKLRMVCFSRTLQSMLESWGFNSMYIQYFPEPAEFFPGNKDEVFFWQRISSLHFSTIAPLLIRGVHKVHIHKAIDPYQTFVQPTKEEEEDFGITYSDWFETKEQSLAVIRNNGIYIAPREFEGIGMSFLEAMAMGKAVVAVNNPTMNEYIIHNETGYLFNPRSPEPIDFKSIESVSQNTFRYIQEGHRQWMENKNEIIDYIRRI